MKTRHAFTLVEILTVCAIIAVLVTLVTVAAAGALRAAKRGKIAMEMSQIAMALDRYKAEFGEYPPDMFDNEALVRHVKKRWPRFEFSVNPSGTTDTVYYASSIRQAMMNVYNNRNVYPASLREEWMGDGGSDVGFLGIGGPQGFPTKCDANLASLCVWLGGFPDREGKFVGFDADPEAPFGRRVSDGSVNCGYGSMLMGRFDDVVLGAPDKKAFLELTINKNVYFAGQADSFVPCIVSRIGSDKVVPIVYFRGRADGGPTAYTYLFEAAPGYNSLKYFDFSNMGRGLSDVSDWGALGVAVPYAKSGDPFAGGDMYNFDVSWCEPTKYQLIHPGLDARFGVAAPGGPEVPFHQVLFRTLAPNAIGNNLGQHDMDNLTNVSDYKELKSILP
jgi:prepilin-type N-terminal cleavage/methylation domain-containing protein